MSVTPAPDLSSAVEVAVAATQAGGAILRERFGSVLDIRYKGEIDVVTEVDVMAEATIVEAIREAFPDHQILAEEGSTGGVIQIIAGSSIRSTGLRITAMACHRSLSQLHTSAREQFRLVLFTIQPRMSFLSHHAAVVQR